MCVWRAWVRGDRQMGVQGAIRAGRGRGANKGVAQMQRGKEQEQEYML